VVVAEVVAVVAKNALAFHFEVDGPTLLMRFVYPVTSIV